MKEAATALVFEHSYNERLFRNKGLISKVHFSRYYWLKEKVGKYCPDANAVIELGCYDGKALDFLPKKPSAYCGYDANWEDSLAIAEKKWQREKNFHFIFCDNPQQLNPNGDTFDISICMETLEHVPGMEQGYISRLAAATKKYAFITVPNEKGIIFVLKHLSKKILNKPESDRYTFKEFFNAFLGRMDKVKRSEICSHKGFDYDQLLKTLSLYFDIIEVKGMPLKFLPASLNYTIGIVLKKKKANLLAK